MFAAIVLCAGKGTRMNDDTTNKVCFPAAGVPVIQRIVQNLRAGGVSTFVIVVGHKAQGVMDALADEKGVIYAYQKTQKGTGHAALCGLSALKAAGFRGKAIITMGDKIISPDVIRGLLADSNGYDAVWGVQPLSANYNGGRVVVANGKPYGVVEFADAALMSLAGVPEEEHKEKLAALRLNPKKAEKVLTKAKGRTLCGTKTLLSRTFSAEEILSTPYANAGLYCFDVDAVMDAILQCDATNAQGEIYLTDTLEIFAKGEKACLYEIAQKADMLTYSTKSELREITLSLCRSASVWQKDISSGSLDDAFSQLYENIEDEKARYRRLVSLFLEKYGDEKIMISRAPGRVNLMGRHIDHRGGAINVMTINRDMVLLASPRKDDKVFVSYTDSLYPDEVFSISECLSLAPHDNWLDYLEAEPVKEALKNSHGSATNYIKSSVLRWQLTTKEPLCGMNILLSGSIPAAAGLSSSSAIVVATAEAVCFLNSISLSRQTFVELCGEAEWFVGSRGGAGDHAAMKCSRRGQITHLTFKPFAIGDSVPFSDRYALIVANSMQKAKKSEGSKDKFNAKVSAYEIALMLLNKSFPHFGFKEFRDIAKVTDVAKIYDMVLSLPVAMTRDQVLTALPEQSSALSRIFSSHADPTKYDVRGVALYGISECLRAEKCLDALREGDYALLGSMMNISHIGDSVTQTMDVGDVAIQALADADTPIYLVAGAYECSTERIDEMCRLLNSYDGVLGSALVGAGLGGCVIALVEKSAAMVAVSRLKKDYYEKYDLNAAVDVYLPSAGSSVLY